MEYIFHSINDFYNRVRSLISADQSKVTDEIIGYYENAPTSENYIRELVNKVIQDIENEVIYDEYKRPIYESCIILKTAINIYPTFKQNQVKVMQTTNAKIEYNEASGDIESYLYSRLNELLKIFGIETDGGTFFMLSNDEVIFQ